MKTLSVLILALLPLIAFSAHQTITTKAAVTIESAKTADITVAGKWSIQFVQDDWIKLNHALYPDKNDRTAAVITAQADFKIAANSYIKLALDGGFYVPKSKGVGIIIQPGTFDYIAMEFQDGISCKITVRKNNKDHTIILYPDLDDEVPAATTARADMVTELAKISGPANTGGFFK